MPSDIAELVSRAHGSSLSHGFWEILLDPMMFTRSDQVILLLSRLALIGEEVGEAVSAVRVGDKANLGEELADICISVFDLSGAMRIDLNREILNKMELNESRPYKHGKLAV